MTRPLRVLLILLALAVTARLLVPAIPGNLIAPMSEWDGDGDVDWWGAIAFVEGWNPYSAEGLSRAHMEAYGFGHPPTTPLWFIPFARMDPRQMHQALGLIVLLLLLLELVLLTRELSAPAPLVVSALGFAAIASRGFMAYHLAMAQISLPIAFLIAVSWYFLRREEPIASGVAVGLACTLKLFPGLIVVLFALQRRWRAVLAATVAYLAFAALATWRYGLACWGQYAAMQPAIAATWSHDIRNGSLAGIVQRLWHPSCREFHPGGMAPTVVTALLSLAMVIALGWAARRAKTIDAPFALFATGAAFLNPWIWEHYRVLLILPLGVAAAELTAGARAGMRRWKVALGAAAWLAVVALCRLRMYWWDRDDLTHSGRHVYEVANWLPWPLMLLLLGALCLRERQERA